jgi:hypothetical protein
VAKPITERAHQRNQRSQPEGVTANDPLQLAGGRQKFMLDRWEGDIDDRDVELDHETGQTQRQ